MIDRIITCIRNNPENVTRQLSAGYDSLYFIILYLNFINIMIYITGIGKYNYHVPISRANSYIY